jgi:rare lipoprotein A
MDRTFRGLVVVALLAAAAACSRLPSPAGPPSGEAEVGLASWYGPEFHGRSTSSGEVFDMNDMTAAHRSLPFGAYVMVTNLDNDRTAVVRINDRGPFVKGRVIDLSYAAARVLGVYGPGTARVKLEVLKGTAAPASAPGQEKSWYVQVGAFSVQENAFNLKAELEKRWNGVVVSTVRTDSAVYYRVRLKAASRQEASELAARLAAEGRPVIIVSD